MLSQALVLISFSPDFLGHKLPLVVSGNVPDVPCLGFGRHRVQFLGSRIVLLIVLRIGQRWTNLTQLDLV